VHTGSEEPLVQGARVELFGLSKDELNGQLATITGPLNDRGRWTVTTDGAEGKTMAIKPDNLRHAPLLTKAELMRERAQKRKEELAAKKAAKAKAEGKPATDAGPRKAEGETPGDAGPRKANLEDLLDDAAKTKQDKKARQKTDAPKVAGFRKQEEHGPKKFIKP